MSPFQLNSIHFSLFPLFVQSEAWLTSLAPSANAKCEVKKGAERKQSWIQGKNLWVAEPQLQAASNFHCFKMQKEQKLQWSETGERRQQGTQGRERTARSPKERCAIAPIQFPASLSQQNKPQPPLNKPLESQGFLTRHTLYCTLQAATAQIGERQTS